MLNKAILMGRLTRDPELRYTQNNTPVAAFTIAVNRNYGGKSEDRQADFIDIVAWNKTAEFVQNWFNKGSVIIVVGRIQSRRWQDRNGNNRTSIEVVAEEVQFGETKAARSENAGNQAGFQSGESQEDFTAPLKPSQMDFEEIADDGEVPF
ncbi:MAG: single-stranded DNA-binding protein [Butyricicoccus sp.]